MKTTLKVSTVLSWFNLVVWGLFALMGILGAFAAGNLSFLLVTFLTGVTVLHSYASLKLHKSIRQPNVPLSDQTPSGIRFIGFIALFLGLMYFGAGIIFLQNTPDLVKMMSTQIPPGYSKSDIYTVLRGFGVFLLVTGLF